MQKMICPKCKSKAIPAYARITASKLIPSRCTQCGTKVVPKTGVLLMVFILLQNLGILAGVFFAFVKASWIPIVLCIVWLAFLWILEAKFVPLAAKD